MTPGECPREERVADVGGGKSYCGAWGRWTNCREAGACTWERAGRPAREQMTIFDLMGDEHGSSC